MFQTISNFMRVRDIRSKIIYTLLVLIVFRLGTFIPVPNVDATALQQTDNNLIGFLNVFGGGALANFSILQWELCLTSPHPSLCNYCRWMLYRNLLNGQNKGTLEDGNLHSSRGISQ